MSRHPWGFIARLTLLAILLPCAGVAFATTACSAVQPSQHTHEQILNYHSDIAIQKNSHLDVVEHLCVWAMGEAIHHGIYRDFPTDYRDAARNRYHVNLDVVGATLDGQPADWHTSALGNGVRIYIGNRKISLSTGMHALSLHYRVTRELGFFNDHDELYWNVNGTGWTLPIDQISANVSLPAPVPADQLRVTGYTGEQGSRAQDLTATARTGGADFVADHVFGPGENLSIALAFPKGVVTAPTSSQKTLWLLQDNHGLLYGLGGLLLLWAYYLFMWRRVGRDPDGGPKVALYEPPDGLSAAAMRYVRDTSYDNLCFSAGILGLAAKGGLSLKQTASKKYTATRTPDFDTAGLTPDEAALHEVMFDEHVELRFDQRSHERISEAQDAHRESIRAQYGKGYFKGNGGTLWPGPLLTLVAFWLMTGIADIPSFVLMLVTSLLAGLTALLGFSAKNYARSHEGSGWGFWLAFALLGLFCLSLWGYVTSRIGLGAGLAMALLLLTNIAFRAWMKAPTLEGARLRQRIEGFRWYLGVAEKQELDARYKPQADPARFSTYLPYAIALGVGNAWAARFADALAPEQFAQAQPAWYANRTGALATFTAASMIDFSQTMSSGFNSSIAASSFAPGTSSGFSSSSGFSGGGGGFSGGGGGGGGGGGW